MEQKFIRNDITARTSLGVFKNTMSHFIDRHGNRMMFIVQGDYKFPPLDLIPSNTEQFVKDMKEFQCKDDDIVLVSYPKSGMHWVGNLVNMLVRGNTKYTGTPYLIDANDLVTIENMEGTRVFGSHLRLEQLPVQLLQGKGKIINISRNPKDCAVSHFTFFQKLASSQYHGDFHSFLYYFYRGLIHYGKWFDHVKGFATADIDYTNANILHLRYEDMKLNLQENIKKITHLLNVHNNKTFLKEVETRCTFSCMQQNVATETGADDRWTTAKGKILPIYTKGQIGEWKNWLTISENEEFDAVIEREFHGIGIHYRYDSLL